MIRRTSTGRDMPMNYYVDTAGSEDDENIRAHLYELNTVASQYGFESLFDVVLAQARLFPKEARKFAESEGLGKLYGYCCIIGRKPITAIVRNDLCPGLFKTGMHGPLPNFKRFKDSKFSVLAN